MNQTDFKTIPLSEIKADKNQPRKYFNDLALQELIDSVREKGVLQPIMVRPNGKGYILVCGERRYRASLSVNAAFKDRNTIPAVIRTLNDQEALEIQFIENIQRDDVHPMDEATTFKSMLENKVKPYTISDIAAKINKPETFVIQRIQLNNLIPEMQKEFWEGKFLVGAAILFARLTHEDQKACYKDCREWGSGKDKAYKSISGIREYIDRHIIMNLSAVPFKKDDAFIYPAAGPCTTCTKRSGCNKLLFDDIKQEDRCFDKECFHTKLDNWLQKKVETIISEEPGTILLTKSYGDKVNPEFLRVAKEMKVKVYGENEYSTYSLTYSGHTKKLKGFYLNGHARGNYETVYVAGPKVEKGKAGTKSVNNNAFIDEEISGIKQRTKRAAELDDEKVWLRIHKEIINITTGKNGLDINMALITEMPLSKIDTAAVIYSMYQKAGSESTEISKIFGFKSSYLHRDEAIKFAEKILNATPAQFNKVTRIFIKGVLDSAVSSHTANGGQALLKLVAEQYSKTEIAVIELEQQEKRTKREERAGVRIKALQHQKKQISIKPAAAAGTDKNSKKKPVKK